MDGEPKTRGIPKEGRRDGIPKEGESQNVGAGMDGGPKIWEQGWMGDPKRVGDPNRGGAAMDGESLRVGDPKIWEQGWDPKMRGIPKEGSRDGWGSQNERNPKLWGI